MPEVRREGSACPSATPHQHSGPGHFSSRKLCREHTSIHTACLLSLVPLTHTQFLHPQGNGLVHIAIDELFKLLNEKAVAVGTWGMGGGRISGSCGEWSD